MQETRIILASQSPRRQELLSSYGFSYDVIPSLADEENVQGNGKERVTILAKRKCDEVRSRFPDAVVIAADTLVCIDDQILGKPKDRNNARKMLKTLSGRWHQVYTGICVCMPDGREWNMADTTEVHFVNINDEIIERYIATGECDDKAGSYAIQGRAGVLIDRIEGSYSNVIGLPMAMLTGILQEAGIQIF